MIMTKRGNRLDWGFDSAAEVADTIGKLAKMLNTHLRQGCLQGATFAAPFIEDGKAVPAVISASIGDK